MVELVAWFGLSVDAHGQGDILMILMMKQLKCKIIWLSDDWNGIDIPYIHITKNEKTFLFIEKWFPFPERWRRNCVNAGFYFQMLDPFCEDAELDLDAFSCLLLQMLVARSTGSSYWWLIKIVYFQTQF